MGIATSINQNNCRHSACEIVSHFDQLKNFNYGMDKMIDLFRVKMDTASMDIPAWVEIQPRITARARPTYWRWYIKSWVITERWKLVGTLEKSNCINDSRWGTRNRNCASLCFSNLFGSLRCVLVHLPCRLHPRNGFFSSFTDYFKKTWSKFWIGWPITAKFLSERTPVWVEIFKKQECTRKVTNILKMSLR